MSRRKKEKRQKKLTKTSQAYNAEKNMTQARDATEGYVKERKDELLRGIDKADHKIEEKAKGWFGGGK